MLKSSDAAVLELMHIPYDDGHYSCSLQSIIPGQTSDLHHAEI